MIEEQKQYNIDVHFYPKTYTIIAANEEEAKGIAREMFDKDTNGQSIYDLEIY